MKIGSKLSFRNKLQSAFIALAILSILITGFFSYTTTANILENNALKLTQDSVVKSAQIVDEKLNKLMLVMMTFMISSSFQNMLKDATSGNDRAYFTHLTNMDNVFSQARIAEPLIQSIYISTPIGEFYPLSMNRNRATAFEDTQLYRRIAEENRNVWIEGHEDQLFTGKRRVASLILQPIAEYPAKDVYVVVNVREDGLRRIVGSSSEGSSSRFLLDASGDLVYNESDPLIRQTAETGLVAGMAGENASGYTSFDLDNKTYLLNFAKLELNDWTVVAIQSKAYVLKDLNVVKWTILLIAGLSLIVTVLLSEWFTRFLLRPLQRLQLVMKRVESNDLAARFESRDNEDELAQLGTRFNRMLEQIVLLIDEVKAAEASKRSAEIKALSAQMDPHFLYNTLNTIYWKLKLNQVEHSQRMVVALSRLFQIGLNKGQEMTTLRNEIEHARQYLALQGDCYENLFRYEIAVRDETLLEQPVPRIIVQPLVENSILHGFDSMETGGEIAIEADLGPNEGQWFVRVRDNGRGMDPSAVGSLYAQEAGHGYAVSNLLSRLQLCYGDEARLTVHSGIDEGTTVEIVMPWRGEDKHE
ncbi:sensor histidine kinase [Cohnella panacarvi]|uniref:sensor histidine kinase n=1 Tax=Cohnella panacarvi TaxID=400776 RepID=UPI000478EEAE|nr:sensor histidine kinase [Cohnella panacarvi]